MNIKGTIISISDVTTLDNGAKKLHFEIDNGDQYNNILSFDMYKSGEYIKFIDEFSNNYQVGDKVDVEFNIKCRKYQGKFYTNLDCWKVSKSEGVEPSNEDLRSDLMDDDLPF